jgi:hypothetical protein
MANVVMQYQIEFPFRGTRAECSTVRRTRRAQWARMWFARMHEIVEEAKDPIPIDKAEQSQPCWRPDCETKRD